MALKPSDYFDPSRVNAGDAAYPQGSFKDRSVAGAGDGTPAFQADVFNDIFGFLQKLLDSAGITPSESPDSVTASDYFDALTGAGASPILPITALAEGEAAITVGTTKITFSNTSIKYEDTSTESSIFINKSSIIADSDDGTTYHPRTTVVGKGISFASGPGTGAFNARTEHFNVNGLTWTNSAPIYYYSGGTPVDLTGIPFDATKYVYSSSLIMSDGTAHVWSVPVFLELIDNGSGTARIAALRALTDTDPGTPSVCRLCITYNALSVD